MNAFWILVLCVAIVFHRALCILICTVPVYLISKVKKKYGGEFPRGNRFVSAFDPILLLWISEIPFHSIRMFYYRTVFQADIAKDVVIYKGCEIRDPVKLHIGRSSIIGDDAILDARAGLFIGENVNLSSGVSIWTLQHDWRDPDFKCNPEHYGPVFIGDRVWLGPGSIILPHTSVNEGAVVAAGAVVTKDVEAFTLVGGIPAKPLGKRPDDLRYCFDGSHRLFI